MTLTHIAERLAVKLSLPVLRPMSVAAGIRTPNLPLAGQTLLNTEVYTLLSHCYALSYSTKMISGK